jgi:hypothetical protein
MKPSLDLPTRLASGSGFAGQVGTNKPIAGLPVIRARFLPPAGWGLILRTSEDGESDASRNVIANPSFFAYEAKCGSAVAPACYDALSFLSKTIINGLIRKAAFGQTWEPCSVFSGPYAGP